MPAALAILLHIAISGSVAIAVAPWTPDPTATPRALWLLCAASAVLCGAGLAATAAYLGRRIRPVSATQVGLPCGLLCGAILGLTMRSVQFSLILYLALLVPVLVAITLTMLVDRPRTGWQS